ncbi:MAG: YlbF family regulator [Syntrophomonadaceae bacterium]
MNSEEIIKIASELGNAIAQSDEITYLKDQQAKIMGKKDAYEMIMRYQEVKTKIDHKLMDGLMVTQQEENHLKILQQQLSNNPDIQVLFAAQEKLDKLMQAVYFAINQAINDGSSPGCKSCCDDSCGGNCLS